MKAKDEKNIGKWRIIEMDEWDQEFIDAEVEGFIAFAKRGSGEFQCGYVHGYIDYRPSKLKKVDTIARIFHESSAPIFKTSELQM